VLSGSCLAAQLQVAVRRCQRRRDKGQATLTFRPDSLSCHPYSTSTHPAASSSDFGMSLSTSSTCIHPHCRCTLQLSMRSPLTALNFCHCCTHQLCRTHPVRHCWPVLAVLVSQQAGAAPGGGRHTVSEQGSSTGRPPAHHHCCCCQQQLQQPENSSSCCCQASANHS